VHHYLNISANSDDAERQSIEPRMSQSSGSITIGMAVPASVGEQWFSPSALRLGNEEGNTRK
jgi:hypothetical protein